MQFIQVLMWYQLLPYLFIMKQLKWLFNNKQKSSFRPVKNVVNTLSEEDDDVKEERQRVVSGAGSCTDAMRLVNLTKVHKKMNSFELVLLQETYCQLLFFDNKLIWTCFTTRDLLPTIILWYNRYSRFVRKWMLLWINCVLESPKGR